MSNDLNINNQVNQPDLSSIGNIGEKKQTASGEQWQNLVDNNTSAPLQCDGIVMSDEDLAFRDDFLGISDNAKDKEKEKEITDIFTEYNEALQAAKKDMEELKATAEEAGIKLDDNFDLKLDEAGKFKSDKIELSAFVEKDDDLQSMIDDKDKMKNLVAGLREQDGLGFSSSNELLAQVGFDPEQVKEVSENIKKSMTEMKKAGEQKKENEKKLKEQNANPKQETEGADDLKKYQNAAQNQGVKGGEGVGKLDYTNAHKSTSINKEAYAHNNTKLGEKRDETLAQINEKNQNLHYGTELGTKDNYENVSTYDAQNNPFGQTKVDGSKTAQKPGRQKELNPESITGDNLQAKLKQPAAVSSTGTDEGNGTFTFSSASQAEEKASKVSEELDFLNSGSGNGAELASAGDSKGKQLASALDFAEKKSDKAGQDVQTLGEMTGDNGLMAIMDKNAEQTWNGYEQAKDAAKARLDAAKNTKTNIAQSNTDESIANTAAKVAKHVAAFSELNSAQTEVGAAQAKLGAAEMTLMETPPTTGVPPIVNPAYTKALADVATAKTELAKAEMKLALAVAEEVRTLAEENKAKDWQKNKENEMANAANPELTAAQNEYDQTVAAEGDVKKLQERMKEYNQGIAAAFNAAQSQFDQTTQNVASIRDAKEQYTEGLNKDNQTLQSAAAQLDLKENPEAAKGGEKAEGIDKSEAGNFDKKSKAGGEKAEAQSNDSGKKTEAQESGKGEKEKKTDEKKEIKVTMTAFKEDGGDMLEGVRDAEKEAEFAKDNRMNKTQMSFLNAFNINNPAGAEGGGKELKA